MSADSSLSTRHRGKQKVETQTGKKQREAQDRERTQGVMEEVSCDSSSEGNEKKKKKTLENIRSTKLHIFKVMKSTDLRP